MRKIELEELKKIELDILKDVAKFCDENNIRYYLAGGTLLGAIRHKGFIPWDDDIDILIPRLDYEKFINLFNKKKRIKELFVDSCEDDINYPYPFAKVMNNRTLLIENVNTLYKFGVYIDIFPLDSFPKDIKIHRKYFKKIQLYKDLFTLKIVKSRKNRKLYKQIVLFCGRNILKIININNLAKKINYMAKLYSEDSDFVGCNISANRKMEKIHSESFKEQIEVEFEGEMFKAPKGYHEYLTNLYGDYMTPPPLDKQKSHHNFEAYWKD